MDFVRENVVFLASAATFNEMIRKNFFLFYN